MTQVDIWKIFIFNVWGHVLRQQGLSVVLELCV
jgi:hypothetical protein